MKNLLTKGIALACAMAAPALACAQLSQNPDKFLGNITTQYRIDTDGIVYADLWNQITPENESKWTSIEGNRNSMNWGGCDNCYNYARQHGFPFKFHCLAWGAQYPGWMDNLTQKQQLQEYIEWLDAVQARYPDLDLIDVVNEAIPGHAPAPYKECLGGDGYSGYDWIVKAFHLARERWPNAILIYNDYNTFRWQKNEFITLVKTLRDAGAPIDAYGCQSHDLTDMPFSEFKTAMADIQKALQMPMYSTEYDIGTDNDQQQLQQYSDQIKYMWEQDYVAGITLWGFIYGKTWVTNGNSGIIRDGKDRPAMTWLRQYMASDEAKATPSPFPGLKKEASLYIRPERWNVGVGEPCKIYLDASLRTKTIDRVELYRGKSLIGTATEAPYVVEYTPKSKTTMQLRAVMYDTEGNAYERLGSLRVVEARKPFHGEPLAIPGTVEFEDFDICGDGISFHDSDDVDEGQAGYRDDNQGVDIIKGGTGYAIGYTKQGEWLEYTLDLTLKSKYFYRLSAASGADGSKITISLIDDETNQVAQTKEIEIENTGDWNDYRDYKGTFPVMNPGIYRMRVEITGAYPNLDFIRLAQKSSDLGIPGIANDAEVEGLCDIYSVSGIRLGQVEIAEGDDAGAMVLQAVGARGTYILRSLATGASKLVLAN